MYSRNWWIDFSLKFTQRTTHQKRLKTVLDAKYLDELISLEKRLIFKSFWRTKEEMAKKRPNKQKIVKNSSFSFIS